MKKMRLKIKIGLIVAGVLVVVAGALIGLEEYARSIDKKKLEQASLTGIGALWQKMIDVELSNMAASAQFINRNRAVKKAMKNADSNALMSELLGTFNRLSAGDQPVLSSLQIAQPDGELLVSFPESTRTKTGKKTLQQALNTQKVEQGLERDDDGKIVAVVAFPVTSRGKTLGVALLMNDMSQVVSAMSKATLSEVAIFSRSGVIEYSSNVELFGSFIYAVGHEDDPALDRVSGAHVQDHLFVAHEGERKYSTSVLGIHDFSGDVVGRLFVAREDTHAISASELVDWISFVVPLVLIVLSVLGMFWYVGRVLLPLEQVTRAQVEMASGRMDVVIPDVRSPPEVADLCKAVAIFKSECEVAQEYRLSQDKEKEEERRRREEQERILAHVKEFQQSIGSVISTLSSTSSQVSTTTGKVAAISERTATQSAAVRESANIAREDINFVADGIREVDSAVNEITVRVAEASKLTSQSAENASKATDRISALNEASEKIKQIVEIIAEIAEQTNLLALNATIEAARAGDTGKGFAVVASEVKSLANQTHKATEDIGKQVGDMLYEIESSTDAVKTITRAVNKTNETVTSIASAVEEQSATTSGLSRSAQTVRDKILSVIEDVNVVAEDAASTGRATQELQQSSDELSGNATTLKKDTDEFVSYLKTAAG